MGVAVSQQPRENLLWVVGKELKQVATDGNLHAVQVFGAAASTNTIKFTPEITFYMNAAGEITASDLVLKVEGNSPIAKALQTKSPVFRQGGLVDIHCSWNYFDKPTQTRYALYIDTLYSRLKVAGEFKVLDAIELLSTLDKLFLESLAYSCLCLLLETVMRQRVGQPVLQADSLVGLQAFGTLRTFEENQVNLSRLAGRQLRDEQKKEFEQRQKLVDMYKTMGFAESKSGYTTCLPGCFALENRLETTLGTLLARCRQKAKHAFTTTIVQKKTAPSTERVEALTRRRKRRRRRRAK